MRQKQAFAAYEAYKHALALEGERALDMGKGARQAR